MSNLGDFLSGFSKPSAKLARTYRCPQCGFVNFKTDLRAADGAFRASAEPAEPCPNDGSAMEDITEAQS